MKIICMGDSITYGYGLADLSQRWTDIVSARTGHILVNRGISGDTTGGMLARCQTQVFQDPPDAMMFLGGINDISILAQYRPVCANVTAIVRQAMAIGLPVIVGLLLPIVPEVMAASGWNQEFDPSACLELSRQYTAWLQGFCAHKNLPVADFHSPFLRPDGTVRQELFQDGIHPTAEGHALMAEVMCQVLKERFPD